jgi:orotate phosphoribosyltransferase
VTPDEALRHFTDTEALLTGHFKLSSGLHSDRYLQCAKVLQWPERARALGAALAEALRPFAVDAVVSPAMGGLIIGHETGRGLSTRALFAERVEGAFTLRRGFALAKDERVAVIEDVVTTGKSTRELELARARGAVPVAAGAIVDRRAKELAAAGDALDGVPLRTVVRLEVDAWDAQACPLCAKGLPVDSPGSRHLS